jgi:porin-like protein
MTANICRSITTTLACLVSFLAFIVSAHAAPPVEYVRVCDVYGAGFFYVPGSDICLKTPGQPLQATNTLDRWGWNVQALGYIGQTDVSSFSHDYNTGTTGGSFGGGVTYNFVRVQLDYKREDTGPYCTTCGHSSYWTVGGHISWNPVSNWDFGMFGGYVDTSPTFNGATNRYDYFGGEARYFTSNWMIGGQFGHLDVNHGLGSMTDAWFGEIRARLNLRAFYAGPPRREMSDLTDIIDRASISGSYGYASGNHQNTSLTADSRQWSVSMNYRWAPTVSTFVGYHAMENKIQGSGTVWDERLVKAGVKINWGSPGAAVPIEPNLPLPSVLGVLTRF